MKSLLIKPGKWKINGNFYAITWHKIIEKEFPMLRTVRQQIINQLWKNHRLASVQLPLIEAYLNQRGIYQYTLDHCAVIDLPSLQSGIPQMTALFQSIGYVVRGADYLPEKQNDFCWLAEENYQEVAAKEALPQVVTADFRLDEMPLEIRRIIEKYAAQMRPSPIEMVQALLAQPSDISTTNKIAALFSIYFAGRDWAPPTISEFKQVHEFNELLAWVLVFGRKPNHFTIGAHLLSGFSNLAEFNAEIEANTSLIFNADEGKIKGSPQVGIEQSSTKGALVPVALQDGTVSLPTDFVEFVWRFPTVTTTPYLWQDFYPDFIARQANRVIQSLYVG
jgi:hypothetical protein